MRKNCSRVGKAVIITWARDNALAVSLACMGAGILLYTNTWLILSGVVDNVACFQNYAN